MNVVYHTQLDKNSLEKIRLSLLHSRGNLYFDIRVFFESAEDEWTATRKGVCFSTDLIGDLVDGIHEIQAELERRSADERRG